MTDVVALELLLMLVELILDELMLVVASPRPCMMKFPRPADSVDAPVVWLVDVLDDRVVFAKAVEHSVRVHEVYVFEHRRPTTRSIGLTRECAEQPVYALSC